MAKVTYKGNTPSWELDEEEKSVRKVAQAKRAETEKKENETLLANTQRLERQITDTLNSVKFRDRSTRVNLQKQLYDYQSNLKRMKAVGYDVSSASNQLSTLQNVADSQNKYYSQFKDEKDYKTSEYGFYSTKYANSSDADNLSTAKNLKERWKFLKVKGYEDEAATVKEEMDWLYNFGGVETERYGRQDRYASNQERIAAIDKELSKILPIVNSYVGYDPQNPDPRQAYYRQRQDELTKEKEKLQAEVNLYERGLKVTDDYYYLRERPDFAEASQYRSYNTPTKEELAYRDTQKDTSRWYSDANGNTYDAFGNLVTEEYMAELKEDKVEDKLGLFLNATEEDKAEAARTEVYAEGTWASIIKDGMDASWEELEEGEIEIYYALLKNQGKDAAEQYLTQMKTELNRRAEETRAEKIANATGWEKVGLSLASIPANIVGGVVGLTEDVAALVTGNDINPYSKAHTWSNFASTVRSETAEDLTEWSGGGDFLGISLGDVYQALMSGADSAVGGYALGGTGYGIAMGANAATSEAKELYEKGASKGQIAMGGILAGAAEGIFEKYSIEKLFDLPDATTKRQVIKNALMQGVTEFSEEVNTEIANTISDALVMGSQSEFKQWIEQYMAEGKSRSEAQALALMKVGENVWKAGAGGFISGAALGGVNSAVNYGVESAYNRQAIKQEGQNIIDSGNVDNLMALAQEVAGAKNNVFTAEGRVGRQLDKVSENVTAKNVGKLSEKVDAVRAKQNVSDIQTRLVENGVNRSQARSLAKLIEAASSGAELTAEQSNKISKVKSASDVANLIKDGEFSTNKRNTKHTLGRLGIKVSEDGKIDESSLDDYIGKTFSGGTETTSADKLPTGEIKSPTEKFATSDDGKAFITESKQDVEVVGIKSISDGNVMLKLDNGETISASEITFGNDADAALYAAVASMDINAVSAEQIVKAYTSDISVDTYARGVSEAYRYGRYGIPVHEMLEKGSFASELSEAQRDRAYRLGELFGRKATETAQNRLRGQKELAKRNAQGKQKTSSEGKLHFDKESEVLTSRQKASLDGIEMLAKVMGNNWYIYKSYENAEGKRVIKDKYGKEVSAPNGMYYSNGDIYIDLFAGNHGEQTLLFTAAHEATHFIKQWSPQKFRELAQFLNEQYGEKGKSVEDMVRRQQAKALRKGERMSYDEAYEEFVADSMETMLTDGDVIEKLAALKARDKTLWEKIKEFFENMLEKLSAIIDEYKGVSAQTVEGRFVAELEQGYMQLQSLFTEALYDAGNTYAASNSGESGAAYSEGKQLSKEQQEYFKNSKVRDAKGNLLPVYHGTNAQFTVFDLDKSGENYPNVSDGFFFFTNKKEAYPDSARDYARDNVRRKGGSENIYSVYLNIEKPLILDSRGYYAPTTYYDKNAGAIYDMYLNGDYDGVIIENSNKSADDSIIYLIDNANQIKSTDNLNPTDDSDIRYSGRDDFEEDKYYSRQIDKWEELDEGGYITVGKIQEGSPLNQVGIPDGKLYFDVSKVRNEMRDRKDPISKEIMKNIPSVLGNPIVITEFVDQYGTPSASVYGKLFVGSSPVVVGVLVTKTRRGVVVNKIQTVHPKRNFADDMSDDKILYLGENKKETKSWFQALGTQMLPLGGTRFGFIRSLSQPEDPVKMSARDEDLTPGTTFYSYMGKVIDDIKPAKMGAGGVVPYLKGKGVKNEEIKWSGIEAFLEGKKSVTKEELQEFVNGSMLDVETTVLSDNADDYIVEEDDDNNVTLKNAKTGEVVETFTYSEEDFAWQSDTTGEIIDDVFQVIPEEFLTSRTRWHEYKLDGGINYRELLFKMPNSFYTNQAMRTHWGDDAEGVLAHARVQDFESTDGKKVLFIEEIQSDWHNEGHKRGYESSIGVPDAPFSNTYHEFVLKSLLRMAAENGYDEIAWTTGRMQEERWSEEYAEGYHIEYDQDIPKFLNKYGKKWGAKVWETEINGGWDSDGNAPYVPSFPITESMKESVLYEGQPMYSNRDGSISNRSLLANALASVAKTDEERQKLAEYKNQVDRLNGYESELGKLNERIKELSFSTGKRDQAQLNDLKQKANKLRDRINKSDKVLLRLEASKPLRNILEAEKKKAFAKAKKQGQDALKEYREKALQKQKDIIQKNKESRKRSVEGRRKTQMKNKIKSNISELRTLLYRGNKKRHVKEGMRDAVEQALYASEVLFTTGYASNEEIVLSMSTEDLSRAKEFSDYKELVLKKLSLEESLENTKGIPARQNIQNEIDKIKAKLSRMNSKLSDEFVQERRARANKPVSDAIGAMSDAYRALQDSEYGYIRMAYDENVQGAIDNLKKTLSGTVVQDMSLDQLGKLYEVYKMVLHTVRNANKAFAQNLNANREELAAHTMDEVIEAGGVTLGESDTRRKYNRYMWNNLKPVYAFEKIGSPTLKKLFDNVRRGEDVWATDVTDAKLFRTRIANRYNYDSWDFDTTQEYTASSGDTFKLNLEQRMSLYAYSKREHAIPHLKNGGFVFDSEELIDVDGKKMRSASAKAYNLSDETIRAIQKPVESKFLTKEQQDFVDLMQDYLSTVMGANGNEVSMALYGVEQFKEQIYFPLKVAQQHMPKAKEQNKVPAKTKNYGFTKDLQDDAKNPVILAGFSDTWASHVNEMSMYHAFTLPMEDFYRVYNYETPHVEDMESAGVQATLENAYGSAVTNYIDQLLDDLNGGARADGREWMSKGLLNKFKKAAVFSSLSVVIQQPSAIGRAFAMVDHKYFLPNDVTKHKDTWAEVKKYAPIAIIKEMGYFDTDMGRSTVDFINAKQYKGFRENAKALFTDSERRDELLSKAPALADELTWCAIWKAVKRETAHTRKDLKVGSEEFMKYCGERFTDVISKTQVYDSVLSRSANMRSKSVHMKAVTAFLAEPTTSINMMEDAVRKFANGDKKTGVRIARSVAESIIINSLLVSIVYAMRDDDDDETFWEKYLASLTSEMIDGFNPITYLPYAKDLWSIAQGYDIERSDMSIASDVVESFMAIATAIEKGEGIEEALLTLADNMGSMLGLPVKNIRRDINAAINTVDMAGNGLKNNPRSAIEAMLEATKNAIPVWGWLKDKSTSDKLYSAIMAGDKDYIERLQSGYADQKAIDSAIRKGLRDNDERVKQAASALYDGDIETYKKLAKEIIADGFNQDNVVAAINAEYNNLKPEEESQTSDKKSGLFKMEHFEAAIVRHDMADANIIRQDIIDTMVANGKTKEEAEESFESSASSSAKSAYLDGLIDFDEAVDVLVTYSGKTEEEANTKVGEWDFELEYGFSYSDRGTAYKNGAVSAVELKEILMDVGGKTEEDADLQIQVYDWQKEVPECDDITMSAVEDYNDWCADAGISKADYYDAWSFYKETSGDIDENGDSIPYSKVVKVMPYIDGLPLTYEQKTALALCWWGESTVRRYKLW